MTSKRLTRDEQRARTRADLLAAATTVFAERGYHAASVDQVAEAAGYTKGAVYSNFSSKEELFLALLDEAREQVYAGLDQLMAEADPQERAAALAESGIATWSSTWFLLEAEFELYAARNPGVRERLVERQSRTRDAITAAIARHLDDLGLATDHEVDDLTRLLVAVADGLSLMALNNPETDTTRLLGLFLDVMVRGATRPA